MKHRRAPAYIKRAAGGGWSLPLPEPAREAVARDIKRAFGVDVWRRRAFASRDGDLLGAVLAVARAEARAEARARALVLPQTSGRPAFLYLTRMYGTETALVIDQQSAGAEVVHARFRRELFAGTLAAVEVDGAGGVHADDLLVLEGRRLACGPDERHALLGRVFGEMHTPDAFLSGPFVCKPAFPADPAGAAAAMEHARASRGRGVCLRGGSGGADAFFPAAAPAAGKGKGGESESESESEEEEEKEKEKEEEVCVSATDAPDVYAVADARAGEILLVRDMPTSLELRAAFGGAPAGAVVVWRCRRDAPSGRWTPLAGGRVDRPL